MDFTGSTVLITGATGNLGQAAAELFASYGARLALIGSSNDSLTRVFPEDKPERMKIAVDLLDAEAVQSAVARIEKELGPVDAVCAAAGGFHMGEMVHETTPDGWQRMMDINAGTLLNTVRAVVPKMIERGAGKIVTVGANGATKGAARKGAYIASKSAVLRITETLSAELRGKGINVNCVMPSTIDTPENRAAMPNADPAKWVAPKDLAAVIAFLCSDEARAVHGALIPVTGLS